MNKYFTIATLFLFFWMSAESVFSQETNNDFEVVEAGQVNQNTTVKTVNTPTPTTSPTPLKANVTTNTNIVVQKEKTGNTTRGNNKKTGDITGAQLSATGNLPLRVEVTDQQPNALITLAVGAATRFDCKEKPVRLVIGNLTDIGVTKAGNGNWFGFYLRPVTGGITTNMFVEFASGATVMINLKTVAPKSLRPGDYNSEVFVTTAAVRDELTRLRQERTKNENELNTLRGQNSEMKTRLNNELTAINERLTEEETWRFLEQTSYQLKNKNFVRSAEIEKVEIRGMSPVWEIRKGTGYVWFEMENKGKTAVNFTEISLVGATGDIKLSVPRMVVESGNVLRFGVKISLNAVQTGGLKLRFVTAGGGAAEIALSDWKVSDLK